MADVVLVTLAIVVVSISKDMSHCLATAESIWHPGEKGVGSPVRGTRKVNMKFARGVTVETPREMTTWKKKKKKQGRNRRATTTWVASVLQQGRVCTFLARVGPDATDTADIFCVTS